MTWRNADTWRGHTRPHGCLRGINSDIGWLGLNHAIGQSGLNCAIERLKSRDADTRSEIHVVGHDPTDYA